MKRTAKAIPVQLPDCDPCGWLLTSRDIVSSDPFLRYKVVLVTTDYPPVLLAFHGRHR